MANHQRGRVDDGHAGVGAVASGEGNAQRHQRGRDQCHEAAITQQIKKLAAGVSAQMQQIKRLEIAVVELMKSNQDRHDLAERQAAGWLPFALRRGLIG